MPLPNFHACRLISPDKFQKDSFKNITRGKGENKIQLVIGKKIGQVVTSTQSIRYPVDVWTEERAKRHCDELGGKFEPAK